MQTLKACELANLVCKYILQEPLSAAFYRGMMLKIFEKLISQIWLIFDFGGGTLDVALVRISKNSLKTIAIDGNNHLGGQDIDHAMMVYFLQEFKKEYIREHNKEPKISARIMARFK